ncbi:uncharacterized protein LOC135684124 [Rhopilema esculentum]|uniref:uncharacterized protein LOC135684124 n=1 Tax=Rhopilema esculentum TaxID=499914 RepID=UPI0031E29D64|eukprot:gene16862-8338_t
MISIEKPGGYDHLLYKELDEDSFTKGANYDFTDAPPCDEESVVVETYAAGVNYADVIIRWGLYSSAKEFVGWPITPGFEFSGRVIKVGEKASNFAVGDDVFGVTLFGGYSKRIKVPQRQIRHIPKEMTASEAAGFPTIALTAWYAMFESCKLRKGDRLLIHSVSGGVGSMLLQMGKIIGCHVTGIVGKSSKVQFAKDLGCDVVIDKSTCNLWEAVEKSNGGKFQAVFDANGTETLGESFNHVDCGGRLVVYGFHTVMPKSDASSYGYLSMVNWLKIGWNAFNIPKFNPMQLTEQNKSVMAFNLSFMFKKVDLFEEAMSDLLKWIEEGKLRVGKVTQYSLKEADKAHKDLESGCTIGKLVLLSHEKDI